MNSLLIGFEDYRAPAERLAAETGFPLTILDIHHFPDGENKITLPVELPEKIIICRSLDNPNAKLLELYLIAHAAREQGCKHICLIAPYLCYMRQDTAFTPGEIISQHWIGKYLSDIVDEVVTVDPHLHRTDNLEEIFHQTRVRVLTATGLLGKRVAEISSDAVLLGPDQESLQWVQQVAEHTGLEYDVATKTRHGDRNVDISLPDIRLDNRDVVLTDDIVSTGHTLLETINALHNKGVTSIYCAVTHGLFVENAYQALLDKGVKDIWTTDSVLHQSNCITLAGLIAESLK